MAGQSDMVSRLAPLFLILASIMLAVSNEIWDASNDDSIASIHVAETFDRTGLSAEMSDFLDWARENGIDFEVKIACMISLNVPDSAA